MTGGISLGHEIEIAWTVVQARWTRGEAERGIELLANSQQIRNLLQNKSKRCVACFRTDTMYYELLFTMDLSEND